MQLLDDANGQVVRSVARRPGLPRAVVARLLSHPDQEARRALAQSRVTTAPTISALASDSASAVRACAAMNPLCPRAVVARMAESDRVNWVRTTAARALAERSRSPHRRASG